MLKCYFALAWTKYLLKGFSEPETKKSVKKGGKRNKKTNFFHIIYLKQKEA